MNLLRPVVGSLVLLDANVLYPISVCDFILTASSHQLIARPVLSAEILDEETGTSSPTDPISNRPESSAVSTPSEQPPTATTSPSPADSPTARSSTPKTAPDEVVAVVTTMATRTRNSTRTVREIVSAISDTLQRPSSVGSSTARRWMG